MKEWIVDSNLLVLLVVGITNPAIISKHKRLTGYRPEDFYRLLDYIGVPATAREGEQNGVESIVLLTPNTLTEASNLLRQYAEPDRSKLLDTLKIMVESCTESPTESREAVGAPVFKRLGFTDSALFMIATAERPLLTVDLDLYISVTRRDHRAAVNFNYHRGLD